MTRSRQGYLALARVCAEIAAVELQKHGTADAFAREMQAQAERWEARADQATLPLRMVDSPPDRALPTGDR